MSVSATLACYTPYGLRLGHCSVLNFERIILYVALYQPLQVGSNVRWGGGGYSTKGWVSTMKLIEKAVAVNLTSTSYQRSGHPHHQA